MTKKNTTFLIILALTGTLIVITATNAYATSWSNNHTNDQSVMFKVNSSDVINFNTSVSDATNYKWLINKKDMNNNFDNLTWIVPDKKGIWEIHLVAFNATESTHEEWIVSTLDSSEAPEFFDYFADMNLSSRNQKDPWGRNLPAWVQLFTILNATGGYIQTVSNFGALSSNSLSGKNISRGTFKFWLYWNDGGSLDSYSNTASFSLMNNSPLDTNTRQAIKLENPYDEHIWLDAIDTQGYVYPISLEGNYRGINEYPVNISGFTASAGWHNYTIIIDENDEVYSYMDDNAIYSTRGHMDRNKWNTSIFNYIQLVLVKSGSYYPFFDGIEVYKDKYLFPDADILFDGTKIIVRKGNPNQNTTLKQINKILANASLFNYFENNNTYISFKPIYVEKGGTLRIENANFIPYYIFLNNSANLYIYNSTLTSITPFNINYTSYNEASQINPNSSFVLREGVQNITILNSTLNNVGFTTSMSPYILNIKNTKFTAMQSNFIFGQSAKMFSMYRFKLHNVTFDKGITFINVNQYTGNGYFGRNEYLTISDVNIKNISIIKSSNGYESRMNLKNVNYSVLSVSESGTGVGEANVSYYSDVFVKDLNNNPINNASVSVINIIDNNIYSMNLNMDQNWNNRMTSSPQIFERNYYKNDVFPLATTGSDGHTSLPTGNDSTTLVILAFQKNTTTTKNMSYNLSVYDNNSLYSSTPTLIYPNGTLHSLSPLATATVSPNSSWYRPNPNTYQNTTVITINRTRTNISLKFENGSITVSNATRTLLTATSGADQSYILFKNTVPEYANRNVNFTVDGVFFANKTADASGFITFNYTKVIKSGSSHTFEWVAFTPIIPGPGVSGDLNGDGVVDEKDVVIVNQHMGNLTWPPFPNYDVNQDGIVDIYDMQFVTGKIPPSLVEQVYNYLKSLV